MFCGAQHAQMRLLVIAQPPEVFQEWLKEQREPAQAPTTPDAIAGEKVFLNGPCMMCHTIRGTLAGGTVAPDLNSHWQSAHDRRKFVPERQCLSRSLGDACPVSQARCTDAQPGSI